MPVRIVLTETSHPGNIGAAARAMKNMGLSLLYLVKPKQFPHLEATIRASGADNILENAVVVDSLSDALVGCEKVYATSARSRSLEWPLCTPREAAEQIAQMPVFNEVAIVFGRESSGLTNDELALSHAHIHIPTVSSFSSLNLGAAVQVMVYEIYMAQQQNTGAVLPVKDDLDHVATADELDGFLSQLSQVMTSVKFLNPTQPKKLTNRLRRLFHRSALTKTEVNILRGFLAATEKSIKR